jgi:DNA-binding transcriptional ArsR family regulator
MTEACDNPQAAAEFLRALAHPMRLQILCRLTEGELSVSGFEAELGLKQPSLSQQLGQLREAGLVVTRREARSIVYRLVDTRVVPVLNALRGTSAAILNPVPVPVPPEWRPIPSRHPSVPIAAELPQSAECGVFAIAGWPAHGS